MRLLICLFLISSLKSSAIKVFQPDTFILENGLKIYFIRQGENTAVSIKLLIDGGKKDENSCQVGYSEVIQQLLQESLTEKQKTALKNKSINCETQNGKTLLSGKCSNLDLKKQIEVLSSVILKLRFGTDRIERIVSEIIESYKPENINSQRVSQVFRDLLLYGPKNPLGRNYCQYQVQKMLPEELREFYFLNYQPKSSSLVISGNFNTAETKKIILRHFGRWKSLRKRENSVDENDLKIKKFKRKEIAFVHKRDSEESVLKWFQAAPPGDSPERTTYITLCNWFDLYLAEKTKCSLQYFKPFFYTADFIERECIVSHNELENTIRLFDESLRQFSELISLKNTEELIRGELPELTAAEIRKITKKYFDPDSYKLLIVGIEETAYSLFELNKNIIRYKVSDFQVCSETCVPVKKRIKSHSEQPRLGCRECWRLGRFWGKNRS